MVGVTATNFLFRKLGSWGLIPFGPPVAVGSRLNDGVMQPVSPPGNFNACFALNRPAKMD